jgi:hypothetical protein
MMMNDVAIEDDEEEYGGKNDDNTDDLNKYRKRNVFGAVQYTPLKLKMMRMKL